MDIHDDSLSSINYERQGDESMMGIPNEGSDMPSEDYTDVLQSDDSADVANSDTTYVDSDDPTYIAQNVCSKSDDDESCQLLLDGGSSPAIVNSLVGHPIHHSPLSNMAYMMPSHEMNREIDAQIPTEVVPNNQSLFIQNETSGVGSRSPSPSDSGTPSDTQEQLGLLSIHAHHQYQPLNPQQQTVVHYTQLGQEHNISTKIRSDKLDPLNIIKEDLVEKEKPSITSDRWLVANINIDVKYKDAFYVQWNWFKIRNSCALVNLAVLFTLLVIGVALLVQMPQGHECDPCREWWQGRSSYHILVPSFKDSNGDGIGDLQGVVSKIDYLQTLGVSFVRLAPMFDHASNLYSRVLVPQPDRLEVLEKTTAPVGVAWNLTRVVGSLGSSGEVQLLAALLHERNMKLVLDLPVSTGIPTTDVNVPGISASYSRSNSLPSIDVPKVLKEVTRGVEFWTKLGIDGFSLPDLHQLVTDETVEEITSAVEHWRSYLDASPRVGRQQRVLILNTKLLQAMPDFEQLKNDLRMEMDRGRDTDSISHNETLKDKDYFSQRLRSSAHLMEEELELLDSPLAVKDQIQSALELSGNEVAPWLLWSVCGVGRPRVAELSQQTQLHTQEAPHAPGAWSSVGRTLMLLFLPGTASIYYGDEVDVTAPADMKGLSWAGIMAWTAESFASFGSVQPFLPLDPNYYSLNNVHDAMNSSVHALISMVQHKQQQPPLFINGLFHYEGDYPSGHVNTKVRYEDSDVLIMERFYPRRKKYTMVANLGNRDIHRDLSHYYYGGTVVASSHHKEGYIKFRSINLKPSEVLICVLDK